VTIIAGNHANPGDADTGGSFPLGQ
jgi:hypothetical protein